MIGDGGIRALREALDQGEFSSVELTETCLARIAEHDAELNAFITVTAERALEAARAADQRIAGGDAGPLTGIPLAHKDIFCTRGDLTTCGSRMLEGFVAPYESTATARLAAAGAVPLGKTNMDEFAMGSSGENSYFGPTRNPWDPKRVPGGSSSGSAAAVAAGLAPAATGTDTGGSIRQPAALCGITGLKPTYGRVSRFGMIAYASSLDQAGVLARSAEDCALVLQAMAGADARDSTCAHEPVPDYAGELGGSLEGLTIGLPAGYWGDHVDADVADQVCAACDELERAGARLVDVSLARCNEAIAAYYVLAPAEASSNLSRYDGVRYGHRCNAPRSLQDLYERTRAEGFGPEVKRRILTGTYALSTGYYDQYYGAAQKMRRVIADDFAGVFEQVDLLAAPTAPNVAFRIGEKSADPIAMYHSDINTVAVNLAGLPAISLPAGMVRELPVGLQLIGPHFSEARLLCAAHSLQQRTDWHRSEPR
ncbi:MAG: Asp-tRNA(Asn)/Glu-tRNA(Gln) amidotransferase subunit GatA [Xanthomonadales bacterium]|nr:Asp-tRNA(Asn)/Glu-tRNA(Gln) amidotransferase subunit GatA [Xanthomonadales bacterium]